MKLVLALALALGTLTGCGASIGNGNGGDAGGGGGDGAGSGGDGGGGGTDGSAAPACANGRTVYLNFEGATLTKAALSDATLDKVSWIGAATVTVPAFHAASATRTTDISTITSMVQSQLAAFPFTVVTTRPTTGPYVMIVYGGDSATVKTQFAGAVNALDCGDMVKSDVGWVQDAQASLQDAADLTIGAIGYGLGLTGTTDVNDCMCGWNVQCAQSAAPCVLNAAATSKADCVGELEPQNENTAFATEFCQ